MTLLSRPDFQPQQMTWLRAPHYVSSREISIVIPVKDNHLGIARFLAELLRTHPPARYPREVIIVDNNSRPPLVIPPELLEGDLSVTLLHCPQPGPASARNLGIQHTHSEWILFSDSDCVPSPTFLSGYFPAMNGSVGYAGTVKAWGKDRWSRYYESQEILTPLSAYDEEGTRWPEYLITANALVWKPALEKAGGFNETFETAAGEDIDLGFRLRAIGSLSYAPTACVYHQFQTGLPSFISRFVRYGRGNKRISKLYGLDLTPKIFEARHPSAFNWHLSRIQYMSLAWGYKISKG